MSLRKVDQGSITDLQKETHRLDDNNCVFTAVTMLENPLSGVSYDSALVTCPDNVTELYTLKTGGSASGTALATVTLVYTSPSKTKLASFDVVIL